MSDSDISTARAKRSRVVSALAGALILVGIGGAVLTQSFQQTGVQPANPDNAGQVALGKQVYDRMCAACHGADLEGHPEWRKMLPTGRMPPPPHDETGHTWHHPDEILFGITKYGVTPPYGPPGYESDMPGFGHVLSDEEIWAVLAYIKSSWPPEIRVVQYEIDEKARRRSR